MAGCASKSGQPKAPRPALTRIQVLPVTPPQRLSSFDHGVDALARRLARNIKEQY